VVYRAFDAGGCVVAVKVLLPDADDLDGSGERFRREARVAARLEHPAILRVVATGEDAGLCWLAMPFVDGPDLERLLLAEGPLDPARAVTLLEDVASALDFAHAHGLVHRDVKPGNVLVEGDHAFLTDFGLTKGASAETVLTATGQFVGTIAYIAPEQARGEHVDARTDVYGLACVLVHALTGGPPFSGSVLEVMYAHIDSPPPSLCARRELPPAVDDAVRRGLAKAPQERPASAGALLAAVREALR
jgi:serine/threonine-protein kinase